MFKPWVWINTVAWPTPVTTRRSPGTRFDGMAKGGSGTFSRAGQPDRRRFICHFRKALKSRLRGFTESKKRAPSKWSLAGPA